MTGLIFFAVLSFIRFLLSTLGGGGGSLVVMPVINFLFGARAVPPSIVGAIAGAYASVQVEAQWLELIIAVFLVISTLWYLLDGKVLGFEVRLWHFSLAGLFISFLSGLIGGVGPLINILYLKYGDTKERIVATRAAGEIMVHVVKLFAYYHFGSFDGKHDHRFVSYRCQPVRKIYTP